MKVLYLCPLSMLLFTSVVMGQGEDVVALKARLERSNSLQFTLGAGTSLKQNNYKGGTLVGIAYQKRLNAYISLSAEKRYEDFAKQYPGFLQRFPQHIIASYLGITKETLSRVRRNAVKK